MTKAETRIENDVNMDVRFIDKTHIQVHTSDDRILKGVIDAVYPLFIILDSNKQFLLIPWTSIIFIEASHNADKTIGE